MSTPSRRRLMRDFAHLQNNAPPGVSAAPEDNNIMKWNAVIFGPEDTPFEGGTFRLIMQFCEDYPNKAPSVKFMCKMFHPNVYADGSICLDVLQKRWSPTYGCLSFFLWNSHYQGCTLFILEMCSKMSYYLPKYASFEILDLKSRNSRERPKQVIFWAQSFLHYRVKIILSRYRIG